MHETGTRLLVGDLVGYLLKCDPTELRFPRWPPDVFAIAGTLLRDSGAYAQVVTSWPPDTANASTWVEDIRQLSKRWRQAATTDSAPIPHEIDGWWQRLLASRALPVADIRHDASLCEALIQLFVAADEAADGVWIPGGSSDVDDAFEIEAVSLLRRNSARSTLCKQVDSSRALVLPKLHTPKGGMTIRSLSHHLALCRAEEIDPVWARVQSRSEREGLNLLLVPFPFQIRPSQFRPLWPESGLGEPSPLRNLPREFGFFEFELSAGSEGLGAWIESLMDRAEQESGPIDGVVFPELALSEDAYDHMAERVISRNAFFVAGVGDSAPTSRHHGTLNCLKFSVPAFGEVGARRFAGTTKPVLTLQQHKHHRWALDGRQVIQYGLGSRLNPAITWWENTTLHPRTLTFVSMRPSLTIGVLICEDLARQEPVAEMVRAVGPNLPIALLMDGPQLADRWPARYATVLADDPGSSVLTLTSAGMAELCVPPGRRPSRVVGMWKDARSGSPVCLELPEGKQGIVLSLAVEYMEEWSADGRGDLQTTAYPIFGGIRYVSADGP